MALRFRFVAAVLLTAALADGATGRMYYSRQRYNCEMGFINCHPGVLFTPAANQYPLAPQKVIIYCVFANLPLKVKI